MDPNPKMMTCTQRAEQILRRYEEVAAMPELDIEPASVRADLIADLHHWSDSMGLDWDSALDFAKQFHVEEVATHDFLASTDSRGFAAPECSQMDIFQVLATQPECEHNL